MPLLDGDVENSEKHSSRKVRLPFPKPLGTPTPKLPQGRQSLRYPSGLLLWGAHQHVGWLGLNHPETARLTGPCLLSF